MAEASLNVVRSNGGEGASEAFFEGGKSAGLGGPQVLLDLAQHCSMGWKSGE